MDKSRVFREVITLKYEKTASIVKIDCLQRIKFRDRQKGGRGLLVLVPALHSI